MTTGRVTQKAGRLLSERRSGRCLYYMLHHLLLCMKLTATIRTQHPAALFLLRKVQKEGNSAPLCVGASDRASAVERIVPTRITAQDKHDRCTLAALSPRYVGHIPFHLDPWSDDASPKS